MARFTLFRRGKLVHSFVRDEDLIRLGRLAGLEVRLEAPTVSREHAQVRREGQGYLIEDRGSVNGVRLNGRPIKCHPLADGDRIQIEDFELVYEPGEEVFLAGLEPDVRPALRALATSDPALTLLNVKRFLPGD